MAQVQTSFIPGAEYVIVNDNMYYCRINGKLARKLRRVSRKFDKPMVELVREALDGYLSGNSQPGKRTR